MNSSRRSTKSELTANDEAYDAIVDLILNQGLRAGERTSVNLLAARLKLGKTPIKDAITRLRTEGLLTVSGRSGTTVNEVSEAQALEMFAVRHLIEDFVAESVVQNIGSDQMAELDALMKVMRRLLAGKPTKLSPEFVRANKIFHSTIVSASGNVTISRLYEQLQIQSQIMHYLLASQVDPISAARRRQTEHEEIVRAIQKKNAGALKKLLRAHTAESEKIIAQHSQAEKFRPSLPARGLLGAS